MALRAKLITEGKETFGLSGTALLDFVNGREEKEWEREQKARELEREREEKERELEREKLDREEKERERERQFKLDLARIEGERAIRVAHREEMGRQSMGEDGETWPGPMHAPHPPMFIRMHTFNDVSDDLETWIDTFERLAKDANLEPNRWALQLSTSMSAKGQRFISMMGEEEKKDYDLVKAELLRRYEVTADRYRAKFKEATKFRGETHACFHRRVGDLFDRWIRLQGGDGTYATLREILLREQILATYKPELRRFLVERGEDQLARIAKAAENWDLARKDMKGDRLTPRNPVQTQTPSPPHNQNTQSGSNGPDQKSQGRKNHQASEKGENVQRSGVTNKSEKRCFSCSKVGHFKRDCPRNGLAACARAYARPHNVTRVKINGREVDCLLDTGLDLEAMVHRSLIDEQNLTGESVHISYANSASQSLPLAEVQVDSPFITGKVKAAVSDSLVYPAMLGCHYVVPRPVGVADSDPSSVEGGNRGEELTTCQQPSGESGVSEDSQAVAQAVCTRADKGKESALGVTEMIDTDPSEVRRLQEACPTLASIRAKIVAKETSRAGEKGRGEYVKKGGTIFRVWKKGDKRVKQLVVPERLREVVLQLGHDSLMAGHLGVKNTLEKIQANFFWPGISGSVKRYVRSCDKCQRLGPRGIKPAKLQPLPVIDQPFKRVGVDLVGPMKPASSRGHTHMVTMIDYATRYADALPLKSIRAKAVAEALFTMWSRVGVPEEVLTDRGSQFEGELMAEVNKLLSVHHLKTTPYHPQTNGLVERWHRSLKTMLKKSCEDNPKDWDRYIPAVLFAYREAPQDSLGFSPFELLYGRTVRGPMAVLHQVWTDEEADGELKCTYQYVMDMRDRLEAVHAAARQNLAAAQGAMTARYDLRAKERKLEAGDEVLLLLPEKHNKLQLAWRGPFTVIEAKGGQNYAIQRGGRKVRVYHINLLKRYVRRGPVANAVVATMIMEEGEDQESILSMPLQGKEGYRDVVLDEHLTAEQKKQAWDLLGKFQEVLTEVPGRTQLAEFQVSLVDERPVRTKPYPLPHAKQEAVKEELREMQELGVIEPAQSPYAFPVVLVQKKDGSNRFCVDYRKLNAVTQFQAESIPDPEVIFSKLARARIFSKVDLSKGYWQIPVRPEDKPKLAFITQEGVFTWNVMPFGVKNAPSVFTAMMRELLRPLEEEAVDNFMDDLLVATETWEEHLRVWRVVLERLKETGLTARPTKCHIGFRKLEYLGHCLSWGTLTPEDAKVQQVKDAERPKTKRQVRAFLGLTGYYRKFVPGYSQLAAPLTDLTVKGKPDKVVWTPACQQAFEALKDSLTSGRVLRLPDLEKEFALRTDASDRGLGAVLLQEHGGVQHPVAYASRKLNGAEQRYSVSEKECLAIVFGVGKFQRYLYGRSFTLETDHEPLAYLAHAKHTSSRLMRWSLILQEYDMHLRYIPGKENVQADYLSRIHGEDESED